ncbi:Glycosyltransferase involved in cell wall bisynthesis [Cyclobacterium lianum]|uniref:Glycosyltransferase involved in cell wall bisynthesis n=1 Tax=Cyclobacterium lianum TaxID=388280 RepID=A0A1M7NGN4_9BACT|nr:glycosyltransferase [Cyclobacterium lianum]SHN02961.1 Glycosyltransferase involved in cell wall bisynthesis [Cyclobacterium lianum]
MKDFPKVLILNQPFNNVSGGGITLSNLFKGWAKEKLAVVCLGNLLNEHTQLEPCDRYYQLGWKEHVWKFPLNLLKRKYPSGPITINKRKKKVKLIKKSPLREMLLKEHVNPFLKKLGVLNWASSLQLSPELCRWLDTFEPDVIYAQAQRREAVVFCRLVQQYLKKPMVFHMMDDWLEVVRGEGILGDYWHNKIEGEFKEMLNVCSRHFSISEPMAREYEKRYGHPFKTFHNPIDLTFWSKSQRQSQAFGAKIQILYAGRMGLGIQSSLELMARCLEEIRRERRLPIELVLQVGKKPAWSDKYPGIRHRGFVPYEELPDRFAEADILFLPYDFTPSATAFIKYSMPTKASEYMISGTPVLVFAPADTALVSYAREHKWAKVVTSDQVQALKAALLELIDKESLRKELAATAIQLAGDKHDAAKVREAFRDEIIKLIPLEKKAARKV